ncbi:RNA recognition motif 2-domain-containing protein [Lobosporangium transversale]|uniref:RNA recognition motif 2-domain-containing protein n=1 Tax=Lobosporangium transversale TaxID=64571 RepID=A0A1Y2GCZ6_9FUNG|nr:RNA recognition motif 2-domain-containing protein [Lobosporangium transversale]ORZ07295.1 RNA recognition motif 2-domain-containing protein [Lobosporangium transversale]|eukprot:XP_021877958.1 RNA recognition motif 2-domain-containing protein [Lobosporangium transversale]
MIRNIPNKYTQQMLLECINETHFGKFDFLYLRMDFKSKCNVGYAFINFINTDVIPSFVEQYVGKKWSRFNSDKICSLSYAVIQGRKALIEKFRNSCVMNEEPHYRPKLYYTSGANRGLEEPFPEPTAHRNAAHRPLRRRSSGCRKGAATFFA